MGAEFSRGIGPKLYVGAIPDRTQEVITVEEGVTTHVVAYIKRQEDRDRLLAALRHLIQPSAWIPDAANCEDLER